MVVLLPRVSVERLGVLDGESWKGWVSLSSEKIVTDFSAPSREDQIFGISHSPRHSKRGFGETSRGGGLCVCE